MTTGSDGTFELRGLVPSEEYTLEFEPEPESNDWSPVTTVKANMAESFEQGDLRLQPK